MSEINDRIKEAAEKGWNQYEYSRAKETGNPKELVHKWASLNGIEQFGILAATASILSDPYAEPYASLMPKNHQQKAYRALDDCLRDALGVARFVHQ